RWYSTAPGCPSNPPLERVCSWRSGPVVSIHMNPVVHKFGGAALADAAAIRHAVDIVARQRQGARGVTIVVSAMGGVTDTLLDIADMAKHRHRAGVKRAIAALRKRHLLAAT